MNLVLKGFFVTGLIWCFKPVQVFDKLSMYLKLSLYTKEPDRNLALYF